MSLSLYGIFIIPSACMTDVIFHDLWSHISDFPRTSRLDVRSFGHSTRLSMEESARARFINGIPDITFAYSTDSRFESALQVPNEYEYMMISVPQGSILDLPGQHDRLFEIYKLIFTDMKAFYAISVQEGAMRIQKMPWNNFRKILSGIHLFSRSLVDTVGRDRLTAISPNHGEIEEGGLWLRLRDDFFYGMPEEYTGAMRSLLRGMWSKVDLEKPAQKS